MSYEEEEYDHGNGEEYSEESPNVGYNGSRGFSGPKGGDDNGGDFQGRPKPQSLFSVRPTPPPHLEGYYGPPRGKLSIS